MKDVEDILLGSHTHTYCIHTHTHCMRCSLLNKILEPIFHVITKGNGHGIKKIDRENLKIATIARVTALYHNVSS